MPPVQLPLECFQSSPSGRRPKANPEFIERFMYPLWPGDALEPPARVGDCCWGEGCLGSLSGHVASATLTKRKKMVG